MLTIYGSGFYDVPYLKVRIRCGGAYANSNVNTNNTIASYQWCCGLIFMDVNVTFIDSFTLRVIQPQLPCPSAIPSYLDVSLDGQIFPTTNQAAYDIVGDATQMVALPNSTTV